MTTGFYNRFMKRIMDLLVSSILFIMVLLPLLVIALAIKLTSSGSVIYWSKRVGKDNLLFHMPKFRTMQVGTA